MSQHKRKIQTVVICGLLLFSSIDIGECAKSKSKSKSGSGSSASRTKVSNTQHANPASFSYSGISPNAPQQVKPSAPKLDQRPSQVNYPQSSNANTRPIGFDVNNQQRPQSAPYPVNTNQQRPPYPVNQPNQNIPLQNSPPYPVNTPQHHAPVQNSPPYPINQPQHNAPVQNSPPYPVNFPQHHAPVQNPPAVSNFNPNQQQPAYNPNYNPQPGYNLHAGHNPQMGHNPQPAFNPQSAYNPQPGYNNPQIGSNPQQAYNPGYNPQPAYNPQPQVVHQFVPVQQQSSGPGILKTVAVGAAAGLGTSLLFNSLTSKDEPKTTVIVVNSTHPIQPAPSEVATQPPSQITQTTAVPTQQNYPVQDQQIPQQIPIQSQPQYPNQDQQIPQQIPIQNPSQYPVQEQTQITQQQQNLQQNPIPIQPLNGVENSTMISILVSSTETILENQSTQSASEISTVSETTVSSNSSPEKALLPVNALSSRATESANLKDSMSSNQPMNTQLSMFIVALSCSVLYLIQ